jgi:outer membrane protein OmpA-like peptidoglycan-associated protein
MIECIWRFPMNKFRLTALSGALILGTLANASVVNAQSRYNLYSPGSSRPSVIVDLTVLDKLGPEPTLPGLLRPRTPVAAAPVRRPESQYLSGNQARLLPPPNEPPRSNVTLPADIRQAAAARPTMNTQARRAPTGRALVTPPAAPPSPAPPPMAKPALSAQAITAPKLVRRAAPVRKTAVAIPAPPPIAAPKIAAARPATVKAPPPKVVAKAPPIAKPPVAKVAAIAPRKPRLATPPPPAPKIAAPKAAPPKAPTKRAAVPPPPALKKPTRPQVALAGPATQTGADGTLQIRFAPKSPDLPNKAETVLSALAKKLNDDPGLRVQLHGYATGPVESPSQARRLSLFRALSVRTFLMKKGVRSTRIDVRALGSKDDAGPKDRVDVLFPQS